MYKRNLNIEVIRIISMLMIVFHHFSIHTNWILPDDIGVRKYFVLTLGYYGKIGVILFILITGFFFYRQTFSLKKIFRLNNQVTFYALVLFFFSLIWEDFIKDRLIKSTFPIIFDQYWFVTGYVLLLLLQPLFKNYLSETPRQKKGKFFFIFTGLTYLPVYFGFIFQIERHFTPSTYLVFLLVVLLGDLIREYYDELTTTLFKYVICTFVFSLILIQNQYFIIQFLTKYELDYPGFIINGTESLNAILFSFSLFVIILKLSISPQLSKMILFISGVTFDVYLIHDNQNIRQLIWNKFFNSSDFYWSNKLFLIGILGPIFVFIACVFIARFKIFLEFKIKKHGLKF